MHAVQTRMRLTTAPISARTLCKLGLNFRFVLLLAWLTLLPTCVRFPQNAQTRMASLSLIKKEAHASMRSVPLATRQATAPLHFGNDWHLPIQYVKGVGPRRAALFDLLGVQTLYDLLHFVPFRYEDRTVLKKVAALCPGATQTLLANVCAVSLSQTPRKKMSIVQLTVSDGTGMLRAAWFHQPYLKDVFKKGSAVMLSGPVVENAYHGALEMTNPQYEMLDAGDEPIHVGRIVPIYHETKGLASRAIRTLMWHALDAHATTLPAILPDEILQRHPVSLSDALHAAHFPKAGSDLSLWNTGRSPAHRRLAFDELFLLQTGLALRKHGAIEKATGILFNVADEMLTPLRRRIPFSLTRAQERVLSEIKRDMAAPTPMSRLVQGDVGCGKTHVALMAATLAMGNGYQAALMAPTEILAEQHALSLKDDLAAIGKTVMVLTGDMKKGEKEAALARIAAGEVHLVIGTHALIQQGVQFKNLGLVVVDEQHKFGVLQRARLAQKGIAPDMLIMTATPIPRTLALTLYGDLNLSVIDEMPPGRMPIRTKLFSEKQQGDAYQCLEREMRAGRQCYVVCPLVEASEKRDLAAVCDQARRLAEVVFPNRRIGLLHGRMTREEKETTMRRFKAGQIDLLVATTVVEVGIDVPNATAMLVEHAERFGLSQLHQLRGRIGRGAHAAFCCLVYHYPLSDEAKRRLAAMAEHTDGFRIAEIDLQIRGPGEFFGTRQSGIPPLRVADLVRDADLLESAREAAFTWVARDPDLAQPASRPLRTFLEGKWGGTLSTLMMG